MIRVRISLLACLLGTAFTGLAHAASVMQSTGVSTTGYIVADSVSLTTASTTWGYLGSAASYVPNLSSNSISATSIKTAAPTAADDVATKAYVDTAIAAAAGGGISCIYTPDDAINNVAMIIGDGASRSFYSKGANSNCAGDVQTRTCTSGRLSGTKTYSICTNLANVITLTPNCTTNAASCTHAMVLVLASDTYTLNSPNTDTGWTNLDNFCKIYGFRAPTTSNGSATGLWSSATNLNRPVTSDQWNPTAPWMNGALQKAFPGGRVWMIWGGGSLTKFSTTSRTVGQSLYNGGTGYTSESYHPTYGGSPSMTSGNVAVGEYVLCGVQ